ncbi:hypothetical protein PIB30_046503, partial [Stylosanthes scabra]|nr:hypothetical protein [Stylosanthes scabra]
MPIAPNDILKLACTSSTPFLASTNFYDTYNARIPKYHGFRVLIKVRTRLQLQLPLLNCMGADPWTLPKLECFWNDKNLETQNTHTHQLSQIHMGRLRRET